MSWPAGWSSINSNSAIFPLWNPPCRSCVRLVSATNPHYIIGYEWWLNLGDFLWPFLRMLTVTVYHTPAVASEGRWLVRINTLICLQPLLVSQWRVTISCFFLKPLKPLPFKVACGLKCHVCRHIHRDICLITVNHCDSWKSRGESSEEHLRWDKRWERVVRLQGRASRGARWRPRSVLVPDPVS